MCQCVKVEHRSLYSSEWVNCAYSEVSATLRISEQAFENAIDDVLLASRYQCHPSKDLDLKKLKYQWCLF
jgi:hypothetical protein